MKKSALATLGVMGACAACCTIPLAIPLLSGLSIAGLANIDWEYLNVGGEIAAIGAGLAAAGLAGGGLWWRRRRQAAALCAAAALAAPAGSSCGCSLTPRRLRTWPEQPESPARPHCATGQTASPCTTASSAFSHSG